jgi:AcrR family transcriptional regulator
VARGEIARRSSYGPHSPAIGARGARTRAQILDTALALFAARGFHATSVDDVAGGAGVSRATLYQYFEGKDEIFAELLLECGTALMRLIRRLGPLGPTPAGFDNLHWWLGEWAWVYDTYATMFVQWDVIDHSGTSFRPLVATFVDAYAGRIASRLEASGFSDDDRLGTGTALLLAVHRFNLYRHSALADGSSDRELLDGLAVVVQLVLFPDTPPDVIAGLVAQGDNNPTIRSIVPRPFIPGAVRTAGLGPRARRTVRQLLDAGAVVFAERGYQHANLDAVAAEAGVARATLYKYFHDKADLLAALSVEAADAVVASTFRLAGLHSDQEAGTGGCRGRAALLRAWLDEFVALSTRYGGVMAVWFAERSEDHTVRAAAAASSAHLHAAIRTVLTGVQRPYPFHHQAAGLVMMALLQRGPVGLSGTSPEQSRTAVVETMARFIERGLLNSSAPGTR